MTFGVKIEGSTALDAAGVLIYILIYLPTIENALCNIYDVLRRLSGVSVF